LKKIGVGKDREDSFCQRGVVGESDPDSISGNWPYIDLKICFRGIQKKKEP
jgi:hypothetical protein